MRNLPRLDRLGCDLLRITASDCLTFPAIQQVGLTRYTSVGIAATCSPLDDLLREEVMAPTSADASTDSLAELRRLFHKACELDNYC